MARIWKTIALAALGIIIIAGLAGCSAAAGISQEEYDRVRASLDQVRLELQNAQQQLTQAVKESTASTPAPTVGTDPALALLKLENEENLQKIKTFQDQIDGLTNSLSRVNQDYEAKSKDLADLQLQYDQLKQQYDQATQPKPPIDTGDVEQVLFALINQVRAANSLTALEWGEYLYTDATNNSKAMASSATEQYSGNAAWQELFWAAGYDTAGAIANGAIKVWQAHVGNFKENVLTTGAKYGTVAAYKQGDIIYITYLASIFP